MNLKRERAKDGQCERDRLEKREGDMKDKREKEAIEKREIEKREHMKVSEIKRGIEAFTLMWS